MVRAPVSKELLDWAVQRSRISPERLHARFPRYQEWRYGESGPTLKQLEGLARLTRTPLGYFFLSEPPKEELPIPDYRTIGGAGVGAPSPDLLETIYRCEQRQEWYRDHLRTLGHGELRYVGALSQELEPAKAAQLIRENLQFHVSERSEFRSWEAALRAMSRRAEESGILVMTSGIVGSNTRRVLDPGEFRGFALVDRHAPLVFINGADTKAAQIFTLAHEIAHIWLGSTGLSNLAPDNGGGGETEGWCNQVAAELLVPAQDLENRLTWEANLKAELSRLVRIYKVSSLVLLRRFRDIGRLDEGGFREIYEEEFAIALRARTSPGGDFYRSTAARVGNNFAEAVIVDTLEGRTLFRDAFRLLGVSNTETLRELGKRLGGVRIRVTSAS